MRLKRLNGQLHNKQRQLAGTKWVDYQAWLGGKEDPLGIVQDTENWA